MAGWAELPQELLRLILHFLVAYTDQVRFVCVCTSWRSLLPAISSKYVQPWLLLPRDSTNKKYQKYYNVHERKFHYLDVPDFLGKKFRGSSHGWLVCIEDSPSISLFNPITGAQIALPPRYKFPDVRKYSAKKIGTEYGLAPYDVRYHGHFPGRRNATYFVEASRVHGNLLHKVVMSSRSTSSNCKSKFMVASIYGSQSNLAYCKLGDKKWTAISKGWIFYHDAIFYEDKLYALNVRYTLEVYELSTGYPKNIQTVELLMEERHPQKCYLVNTSIGLLQVHRYYGMVNDDEYPYTSYFNLYKYESRSQSWCKVENIGESVLFLGLNMSVSIAICDLPPGGYYKGNCIYFTDDNLEEHEVGVQGGGDIGFYDLDSRRTKYLLCDEGDEYMKPLWPTPIWYIYNPKDFMN